ncbi:MAG: hypothetical protein HC936_10755 [Leptolyngbyaceae cyanobacterium SU_3_3]|nr:hypothetical protein [Leptolyngbyaceae cyanobacterium SU_3_3]
MSRKTQAIWRKQLNAEFNLIPFYVAILAICAIALSSFVIQDFSGSLTGSGDEEQWEYAGFYVFKNLRFTPFPQLDLVNNQVFYPYGTNSIFQPWSLERRFFLWSFLLSFRYSRLATKLLSSYRFSDRSRNFCISPTRLRHNSRWRRKLISFIL